MADRSVASVGPVMGKLAEDELIPILLALRYKITYREIGQLTRRPATEVAASIRTGLHRMCCEFGFLPPTAEEPRA